MTLTFPLITVVVPAHNAARDIVHTLDSIQAQTVREIEVLVVDDGSTDDTAEIVQRYAAADPRIRLIRQANAGVGAARNTAIREARGQFVAPVDADDLWFPDKLERQLERIESAGTKCALVYCWSRKISEDGLLMGFTQRYTVEGRVLRAMVLRNFIGNASVPLIRTSALERVGHYLTRDEQRGAQGCEDWDLHLRIAEHYEIHCVPAYLVDYRQGRQAMSVNAHGMIASYQTTMHRLRTRNPDLPRSIFRWSAGHFYAYLARRCYLWRNYRGALYSATQATLADPASLLNARLRRFALGSLFHLALPRRHRRPATGHERRGGGPRGRRQPEHHGLFERIQARRWAAARHESESAPLAPKFGQRFHLFSS